MTQQNTTENLTQEEKEDINLYAEEEGYLKPFTEEEINIRISEQDLKELFLKNPSLKSKDNILYFEKLKGGLKENDKGRTNNKGN